jgi:hypothetical protein
LFFLISVGAAAYFLKSGKSDNEKEKDGAGEIADYPDKGPFSAIIEVGDTVVTADSGVVSYVAKMSTDYDGAPKAYGPPGTNPLDALANAGRPGKWWGVLTDAQGNPVVQGPDQPAPGFYVSVTALRKRGPYEGQYKYIDASVIPYVSIPKALLDLGVRLGNLVKVSSGASDVFAVVADIGPAGKIGEGSAALKSSLPIPSDGVYVYKIYTGVRVSSPYDLSDIREAATRKLQA